MKKKKKVIICVIAALAVCAAGVLGGIKLYRIHLRDQPGILLAFDDYAAGSWEAYFDMFDEHNVKVTFFINAAEPTDFCYKAIERGHEIGYHSLGHKRMTELTEEEVYEQAIAPLEVFREGGIEMTTFAYPYGGYNEELNERLLQYYNVLRGAFFCEPNIKHNLRKGFVESLSIDNINYETQEEYEERISAILETVAESKGTVISFYSHAIDNGGLWCVSEDKLLFLFEKAEELGLKFYTFKELQEN